MRRNAAYYITLYGDYLGWRIAARGFVYVEVYDVVTLSDDAMRDPLTEGITNGC